MLFNSIEYLIFLSVAFVSYHGLPLKARKYHLFIFSYLFYFSWSIAYAVLLCAVSWMSYLLALNLSIARTERQKQILLWSSSVFLVGTLSFFKYLPFTFQFGNNLLSRIVIPLGISYYTFKLISYVVDVYWKKIEPEKDFISFSVYVSFFPQILSGPIERAVHFLPQIKSPAPVTYSVMVSGLRLILFGFFKKMVIADRLAIFVNAVYATPETYNSFVLVMAAYGFMFQLYADFSGLTDIARGSARLFGFESPWNFNLPFFASNLQQYWRRWHMTLTQWLADYVFKPLHLSLRNWGSVGLLVAIFINMVLIGVWHGAALHYLLFGVVHGLFLIASVLTLKKRDLFFKCHPWLAAVRFYLAPVITFHLVVFASIFFRSETVVQAFSVIQNIFGFHMNGANAGFFPKKDVLLIVLGLVMMEVVHYLQSQKEFKLSFYRKPIFFRWAVYYTLVACVLVFGQFASQNFIYFKF